MLYMSNATFVQNFVSQNANIDELLDYCEVSKVLISKYGKELKKDSFLNKLSKIDENLYSFVRLLIISGKLTAHKISDLERIFKTYSNNYSKKFSLNCNESNKVIDNVTKKLSSLSDNLKISNNCLDKVGLEVKGEGYYYTRNLDNDLDKLLK